MNRPLVIPSLAFAALLLVGCEAWENWQASELTAPSNQNAVPAPPRPTEYTQPIP